MDKKVSIVLPVYNGERYLKESIESILNQTYSNWELIIVNDCSTDSTSEIINSYAKKDNRIKIINNDTNLKLPKSLNVGFDSATGEYYSWTSDDNMYKENAIEYMVNFLNENPNADLISCNFNYIGEKNDFVSALEIEKRTPKNLLYINDIGACFMYRASIANKVGEYDANMFLAEDYDYWMRIASTGNIAYSSEILYLYRSHENSLSLTRVQEVKKIAKKARRKNLYNLAKRLSKNFFHYIFLVLGVLYDDLKMKPLYCEKLGKKRILHIFGIKISYKNKSQGSKK